MMLAHFMLESGVDPDTYCAMIPPTYVPRNYTAEDILRMSAARPGTAARPPVVVVAEPGEVNENGEEDDNNYSTRMLRIL